MNSTSITDYILKLEKLNDESRPKIEQLKKTGGTLSLDKWRRRYDDLVDGKENPIDLSKVAVSTNGIELQDRELVAAIKETGAK